MLDIFLEPQPDIYCPLCGQEADLTRGKIDCSRCSESFDYDEEACYGY